jgi:class 3 adenylate cyclase
MVAVAVGRNWHASWWEWHVLMVAAFGVVAVTTQRQWHEERFSDLYLDDTTSGTREISVLFADLAGFTSFSERHHPREVSAMLNEYFDVAVPPVVQRFGGSIDRIIGDALMVVFNRHGDQPDHAERAAGAALAIQQATGAVADKHPGWPRMRIGVNSGEAIVAVLGTGGGRTHTVLGDTVNVASRLQAVAPVGGVVVGTETARRIDIATEPIGPTPVKGRDAPVEAYLLVPRA